MSATAVGGRQGQHNHYRGLDGLRGLAVVAVVLYHGGVSWAAGGFLGVEAFFVLSGFLITSLLVAEWTRSGSIALRAFWGRRARRLLPALLCLVSVIGIYYAFAGPAKAIPGLKADGLSTLLYTGNWHQIASGSSYFGATGPVSPLKHTWSLAIEEQFYLFWPLLLLGVLWLVSRRKRHTGNGALVTLFWMSVAGAVASAVDMALLFRGGSGLDRVYYGTDTRAGGLLAGAALALALALFARRGRSDAPAHEARTQRLGRRLLGPLSAFGLLAVLAAIWLAQGDSAWLYPFGLVGIDLAVLLVIAAVVLAPQTPVARALSLRPIRAIGTISYGIYLWHFPLFLWLDQDSTGLSGAPLLLLRVAVTLIVSVLSFVLVEQPVRRRRVPAWLVRSLTPVAVGGAAVSILIGSALGSVSIGSAAAMAPPAPAKLKGNDPACAVRLTDTAQYGLAPYPLNKATKDEYEVLGNHSLVWGGSSTKTFHTCPPKKVLLVGDSLAFTLGVGMTQDEDRYGIELANGALLGCAFTTSGELNVAGTWEGQSAGCPTALQEWSRDEQVLHPRAVIMEFGYRDQFDWRWGSRVGHLGQAAYDAYLQRQIDQYVKVLGRSGTKILLLSVPWTAPPSLPDGAPAPAASPARHAQINAMLRRAASRYPGQVQVLNIDSVISPANHYQATLNGQLCRFDGVHFTLYCAKQLEPSVLGTVRKMIG